MVTDYFRLSFLALRGFPRDNPSTPITTTSPTSTHAPTTLQGIEQIRVNIYFLDLTILLRIIFDSAIYLKGVYLFRLIPIQ